MYKLMQKYQFYQKAIEISGILPDKIINARTKLLVEKFRNCLFVRPNQDLMKVSINFRTKKARKFS